MTLQEQNATPAQLETVRDDEEWTQVGETMEAPGGVEPPTNSLGNCCSIHLSYGAVEDYLTEFRREFTGTRENPS